MHHGLIFPEPLECTEANLPRASEVRVGVSDNATLMRASDSQRLICPGCLGHLIVERTSADDGQVSHFRHRTDADADCIFRVNWTWSDDDSVRPTSRRGEDPGKLIERLLLRVLQRNASDRSALRVAAAPERLPHILIDGLAGPAEILSYARGDEARWQGGYDARRGARETLFFVAAWDLAGLDAQVGNALLARRPWIVVAPARPGQPQDRFAFVSELPHPALEWHPLADLDLALVDSRALFGLERSGEVLFVRREQRLALAVVSEVLSAEAAGSPLAKLLRLLAKLLLVDGAALQRALFGQERQAARRPYRPGGTFPSAQDLPDLTEFLNGVSRAKQVEKLEHQTCFKRLSNEYVAGYLQDLWDRTRELAGQLEQAQARERELTGQLEQAHARERELQSALAAARADGAALEARLEQAEQRTSALEAETRALKESNARLLGDVKRLEALSASLGDSNTALEQKLHSVQDHWYGRLALRGH